MKASLNHPKHLEELKIRILMIGAQSEAKWGKMNAAQMLRHCDLILQVSFGRIMLPKINFFLKSIGVLTRYELKLFNNGILPNMPTFKEVIIKENCNFDKSREDLLASIDEFAERSAENNLMAEHVLFGKMSIEDWGFMEYKHLNHHLKQFGV